jgi:rubredoxin
MTARDHVDRTLGNSRDFGLGSPTRSAALALWGAGTPLKQKGQIPAHTRQQLQEAGRWMCLTCLFADNTPNMSRCDVCGSANPTAQGAEVQQECHACHFLNSPFARACDMCSKQLHAPPTLDASSFAIRRVPEQRKASAGWRSGGNSDSD